MIFSMLRGRARRVSGSARRRTDRSFTPSIGELLEGRQLLAAGPLGLNVVIDPYASLVDEMMFQPRWDPIVGQPAVALNASGDPSTDATFVIDNRVNEGWDGPDAAAVPVDMGGTYHLSFNGLATIVPQYLGGVDLNFHVQNQLYNAATNTTTADLVAPTGAGYGGQYLGVSFTNTQATAASPVNTGFSNAKLIQPGYAANTTQLYTNNFLAALKPYSVLRYFQPDNVNNQPFLSGNTLVTVDAPQVDQTGLPWEYQVALANQTNTDMWINIPQGATNAYVTALAGIIQNGGTVAGVSYPGLKPNLKVYLEYSNEVWGGIPFNEYYQEAAVQNIAANQPLSTFPSNLHVYDNADGTSSAGDVNTAVERRYLERTADIGQIFQGVMGSDPTHQRIRPVLGWQENNTILYTSTLDWYQHYFGSASSAFYGMGNANYFNPTDYTSVDTVINSLIAQEPAATASAIQYTTIATSYGLKNVSYEGGPSLGTSSSTAAGQVALAASRDPRMEQIVQQYYSNYYAAGGNLAVYFNGPFSIWSPSYSWSASELSQIANPSASPKYRGIQDLAAAAPMAITAGVQVAASGATTFAAVDTLGNSYAHPNTGYSCTWLLNVAAAGTYDLSMASNGVVGYGPGQVQVLVNGKLATGVIDVTPLPTADLGNLTLAAGLNAITVVTVRASYDPSQPRNNLYYQFGVSSFTLSTAGAAVPIGDSGFESVGVGSGYAYNPAGSAWTFSGGPGNGSGLTGNNTAFTSGNPAAPQGSQVAFLQTNGTITQTVAGWSAGNYTLSFSAAKRGNNGGNQDFQVLVDGAVVGTFAPGSTSYQAYTTGTFAVSAGSHVIKFVGLDSVGGDNTAFIDGVTVAVTATAPTAPIFYDPGFEISGWNPGTFLYNPTGTPWTFSGGGGNGSGLASNGSPMTSANPPAPDGTWVAFIQKTGTITQSLADWQAGSYTVSINAAMRATNSAPADFQVLVDGKLVGTFAPTSASYQSYTTASFTVAAGTHTVQIVGLNSAGGDNTVLIDSITAAVASSAILVPSAGDSGFEAVNVGGGYAYNPTGSAWTFSGGPGNGSGLTGNNTAFTSGNPAAPQGSQVAFLQTNGSITQTIAGWSAGNYTLSFSAAKRGNNGGNQDFQVLVDGAIVGTFAPGSTSYQAYTTGTFAVSAGSHVIKFVGLDSVGGDNTAFIDGVTVAVSTTAPAAPTAGDSGFEAVNVGGGYAYNPAGSAWTFSGGPGNGSGLTGNNTAFTSGNPAAPQGSQVAFLQANGSITQTIAGWSSGSYAITFSAARRGNNGGVEDFQVLLDGVVVGTFKPTGTSYQSYSTSQITVSAGTHVLKFLGLDSAGGDNTDFIDNVTIH